MHKVQVIQVILTEMNDLFPLKISIVGAYIVYNFNFLIFYKGHQTIADCITISILSRTEWLFLCKFPLSKYSTIPIIRRVWDFDSSGLSNISDYWTISIQRQARVLASTSIHSLSVIENLMKWFVIHFCGF